QLLDRLERGVRVEDAHHDLLAERGGHGGQAHLDLAPAGRARLDPAVLRPPPLGQVHPPEHLDPRQHRGHHRRRHLEDLVQHAIDAEAHAARLAPRLQVDVGGALLVGVLQQPVDDVDDVVVVGADLAHAPQLDQLLEARRLGALLAAFLRPAHRAGDAVELHRVAVQVERVGDHQLDFLAQQPLHVGHPLGGQRLAGGDAHAPGRDLHRQDPVAPRVGMRDHGGDRGHVDPGRVDAQVGQAAGAGQPLGQGFQPQLGARRARRGQLVVGQQHQRVHGVEAAHVGRAHARPLGVGRGEHAVGDQRGQHRLQRQPAGRERGAGPGRRQRLVHIGPCAPDRGSGGAPLYTSAPAESPGKRDLPMTGPTFQELIQRLNDYWGRQGCVLIQPLDLEVGAGTFHPATFLRALGPEPWNAAYVQPSRRPTDGRYGENPNRLQHYYQYQVVMKPNPDNIVELYFGSLKELGIDPLVHDLRLVEDNWESPTLGAWGLGWEVWLNGMEITQFTYFQQAGGLECRPVLGEITYGLERLCMYLQDCDNVYDLVWTVGPQGVVTY